MRARAFLLSIGLVGCSLHGVDSGAHSGELGVLLPGVEENLLDRATDPCDDFYQFACGGYLASPADPEVLAPTGAYGRRAFIELRTKRSKIYDIFLDEPATSPLQAKVQTFYRSCLRTDAGSLREYGLDMRERIAAATSPADLARVAARVTRAGENAFFDVRTGNRGRLSLLDLTGNGVDQETNYDDGDARVVRAERIRGRLRAIFGAALSSAEADRVAMNALEVERRLAQWATPADGNVTERTPVSERALAELAPSFDWRTYLAELGAPPGLDVLVPNPWFLPPFDATLQETSLEKLRDYLLVHATEAASAREETSTPDLRRASCRRDTTRFMGDALWPRFLELMEIDGVTLERARALFESVKDAFGQQLEAAPFLDDWTRSQALVKLAMVSAAIGPSANLDDFSDLDLTTGAPFAHRMRVFQRRFDRQMSQLGKPIDVEALRDLPSLVSASAAPTLNQIHVFTGMLGGAFFSPNASHLTNAASLGFTFGHEIGHLFGPQARRYDGSGLERAWWSDTAREEYDRRTQCLVAQYDAFTLEGVRDPVTGLIPAHVNGRRTVEENFADNVAVAATYAASGAEEQPGPLVAGFTPAQQFFIGQAQESCSRLTPEQTTAQLRIETHAPPKARVNIPFANSEAFARAFRCKAGAPMAPSNRCVVW